jgi:Flp pilus assembly protein CpaB
MRAMRVVLEHTTRPEAGDVVDLLATFDPAVVGTDADPTLTVAEAVTVTGVDRDEGPDGAGGATGVTVLVTPEQARRIAFAASAGTLALSVAPPEAARVSSAR